MNPRVSQEFTGHDARVLRAIEADTGKWFHFEGSEGLPLEHFAVLMEADREQVLERALPFREGEEVYLEIIEPHMYSAGDAVAKVDGYIISVKGAEGAVGQKRLVRIEEVGRTEAVAVLIDQPPVKAEARGAGAGRSLRRRSLPRVGRRAAAEARADAAEVPADAVAEAADQAEPEEAASAAEPLEDGEATPKPRSTRTRARARKPAKQAEKPSEQSAPEAATEGAPELAAKVSDDVRRRVGWKRRG